MSPPPIHGSFVRKLPFACGRVQTKELRAMDEPLAPNPPEGAVLDYYLKTSLIAVQLEIFDSEGKLVRRFASNDELHKTNSNDVQFQVEWLRDPKPLLAERNAPISSGTFVTRCRRAFASSFWGPAGPLAVPATTP